MRLVDQTVAVIQVLTQLLEAEQFAGEHVRADCSLEGFGRTMAINEVQQQQVFIQSFPFKIAGLKIRSDS